MPIVRKVFPSTSPAAGTSSGSEGGDWISKTLNDLKDSSTTKQLVVGTGSGFATGFVTAKFGKAAAAAIGGTLILVHLGCQYGYITVDWSRLQKDMQGAQKEIKKRADKDLPRVVDKVQNFVSENVYLATSFGGGFLLGFASG